MSGQYTVFLYGTLMVPEIFFSACYNTKTPPKAIRDLHTFTPAKLSGYCRHRVQYADYPAIIAEEGHSVRGIYATGLTEANMEKLDYFEGSEYERSRVTVNLVKVEGEKEVEGDKMEASTYVFKYPRHLEFGEWDFDHFRNHRMKIWTRGDWSYEQDYDDKASVQNSG